MNVKKIALFLLVYFETFASSEMQGFVDTEIELFITEMVEEVYKKVHIDASNIRVFFITENSINAFVDENNRIYVFSGLLLKLESALQVFSVLCHEIGHLACHHISRLHGKIGQLNNLQMATLPIFILAGIANPGVAIGSFLISGGLMLKELCNYTVGEEMAADEFALNMLVGLNYSTDGLVGAFKNMLSAEKVMDAKNITFRTHPLIINRIKTILAKNAILGKRKITPFPSHFDKKFERIFYKLSGFMRSKKDFYRHTLSSKKFIKYGEAVLLHKEGSSDKAVQCMDELLSLYPNDPHFLELKGQILFESGGYFDAVTCYADSISILNTMYKNVYKKAFYIYIDLVKCLIQIDAMANKNAEKIANVMRKISKISSKNSLTLATLDILKHLEQIDDLNLDVIRCMLACYRRLNDKGMSLFIRGKLSYIEQRYNDAIMEVSEAMRLMKLAGKDTIMQRDFLLVIKDAKDHSRE